MRLFQSVLNFQIPPSAGGLLSNCGSMEMDHIVNETKAKVFVCFKIFTAYFFKKKPKALYAPTHALYAVAQELAPVLVEMLATLKDAETATLNGYVNTAVKVGIDILCTLAKEEDFRQFFMLNSYKLFMQVVLPYLRLSAKEREELETEPKEFVNYGQDICQKQKSRTYKSQAAKLFENLVDNIDGMLTFSFDLLLQMLASVLAGEAPVQAYVREVLTKFNLQLGSEEELLDMCLLALTIVSYSVVKRAELLGSLDSLLAQHLDKLMGASVLIRSRTCLLLAFYLDQLFASLPDGEAAVQKCMLFLFQSVGLKERAVSLQALDALSSQINEGVLKQKV